MKVLVIQSCLTLCNPMDVTCHGILQGKERTSKNLRKLLLGKIVLIHVQLFNDQKEKWQLWYNCLELLVFI